MPFVIPLTVVPVNFNVVSGHRYAEYDGKPTVEQMKMYEEWLCEELALVREAINVAKYGAGVSEVVTATSENEEPVT